MKEIKFRAWDKDKRRMLSVGQIKFPKKGYGKSKLIIKTVRNSEENKIENPILMQFTGLLDKNGKEIYDGDILSYSTKVKENGKIQFNSDRAQFEVFWKFGDVVAMDSRWTKNELEIIGNIYENSELLTNQ